MRNLIRLALGETIANEVPALPASSKLLEAAQLVREDLTELEREEAIGELVQLTDDAKFIRQNQTVRLNALMKLRAEVDQRLREVEAGIGDIDRAEKFGLATDNFIPLMVILGYQIPQRAVAKSVVPEDFGGGEETPPVVPPAVAPTAAPDLSQLRQQSTPAAPAQSTGWIDSYKNKQLPIATANNN